MASLGVSTIVAAAVLTLPAGMASAQAMTGAEIKAALEGNSISNENEVQYFDPDGSAIYRKGDKRVTGKWGVEGDKFCSDLKTDVTPLLEGAGIDTEWLCTAVMGDSKRISFLIASHAYTWMVSEGRKVD